MTTIGVDIRVLGTGRSSGVEEYTEQLLAHMLPMAQDVSWKLFSGGRRPVTKRPWMDLPSVSMHGSGRSNRALWLRTWLTGQPLLDRDVGGADVFFFPHFLLGALSPACRRVMTWHDLSYERMPELLSWHRRFWHAIQMRPRFQARSADRVIAVSRSTAADLGSLYGIDRARITVIPSGVDPALRRASEPSVKRWRDERGIPEQFILAVGTREPRKNLPSLVRAWDRIRRNPAFGQLGLVIAGEEGWNEHELMNTIAASRTPAAVRMIGRVDATERSVLYSACAALVYPSLLEGFGFPPLEAMACGAPVIASATSSMTETAGDAALLVDPYRTDELVAALLALLGDAGLRTRLIARGYDRVRMFSWQEAARQTLSVLREAAAHR